jgi:hypothetical protein
MSFGLGILLQRLRHDHKTHTDMIRIQFLLLDTTLPYFLLTFNALLTGKLGAQRVIFPSAATC